MQCLIIGYGSIGKRHADVLMALGCSISLVTKQKIANRDCYESIAEALNAQQFDYVIIANATNKHYASLLSLIACDYRGVVLIEKPLFAEMQSLPANKITQILVAYNLRFHELFLQLKQLLAKEKIITFSAYVGQYLPTWRNNRDYRECYSAKKADGGGVLRDLSHELDYSLWFCGKALDVTAIGGQFSSLEIDSDDVYSILMKCENCPVVNLHLNYLDRQTRREIVINTQENTYFLDLIKGELKTNGEICSHIANGGPQTYLNQHQALLNKKWDNFCSFTEGLNVMKLITGIENSTKKAWGNL